MLDIPAGFEIRKVNEVPDHVRSAYKSKWFWLKQRLAIADVGEILHIKCPDRRTASSGATIARQYFTDRETILRCRTFTQPNGKGCDLFIEIYNKNEPR